MNCFNHPELVSVAVCQDCQKGLCHQCASKYSPPICSQCSDSRVKTEKTTIYKEFLLYFGLGSLIYFILVYLPSHHIEASPDDPSKFMMFLLLLLMGGSIVAGWKTLDGFTSRYFLFLPIFGWVIYFMLKLGVSGMIGPTMLPIRIYRNVRRLTQLNKIPK